MLVKYSWFSGITSDQLVSDIVALLTGSSSFSANMDSANTEVVANTIASNWELHDSPISGVRVLKSKNVNGSYKYAKLDCTSTTGILVSTFEYWDPSSHTGLNQASGVAGPTPATTGAKTTAIGGVVTTQASGVLSVAGTIYIFATARNLIVDGCWVGEFAPVTPALNESYPRTMIASLYPEATGNIHAGTVVSGNTGVLGICRIKNVIADGDMGGGSNVFYLVQHGTCAWGMPSVTVAQMPNGDSFFQASTIFLVSALNNAGYPMAIGELFEIISMSYNITINRYDEIVIDGATYVKLSSPGCLDDSMVTIFVPKG